MHTAAMKLPLVFTVCLLLFFHSSQSISQKAGDIANALLHVRLETTSNFPTAFATGISEQCLNDSVNYMNAYNELKPWALQMFEATGKMPEGFYVLSNFDAPGLFDECLAVKAPDFKGKYCTAYFRREPVDPSELDNSSSTNLSLNPLTRNNWLYFYQILNLVLGGAKLIEPKERETDIASGSDPTAGYCIPSSCSAEDFRKSVAQLIGYNAIGDNETGYSSLVSMADESECYTIDEVEAPPTFDAQDITVLVILCILGAMIVGATLLDIWFKHYVNHQTNQDGLGVRLVLCFSAYTNSQYLLSTKASITDNLACLNGLRVLSTTWIVLYHVYYLAITEAMFNRQDLNANAKTWPLHGVLNATIAVDTFFVMSGLLVAYSLMKELDRNNGKFNVVLFYVHRYLRLTIVYAFILAFIATLLVHTGTGPFWYIVRYASTACRWNWWNNLLYFNNYYKTYPRDCMGETWYLAAEMQMFILSPIFICLLWRSKKLGLLWSSFIVAASLGGTLAIYIVWDLPAMGFFTRGESSTNPYYYAQYYVQMWTRWPPYVIGTLLGWLLHVTKNKKIELTKIQVTIGWCCAIVLGLAVIYGMAPYTDPNETPEINDAVRVLYGTFHRFAWAVCIAWIIFACLHGYGGFVNRLLSWNAFIPLARLTYVIYLVHLNYLYVYHGQLRKPYYYTTLEHAQQYFGVLLLVFLLAFFICLTIEVPFSNVERLLLPSRKRTGPRPQQVDKTPDADESMIATRSKL